MNQAAVIGWPLHHSLSPTIHNYWLSKYHIHGSYDKLAIEPADLESFLKYKAPQMAGFNITIPYKIDVYNYILETFGIEHLTPLAQQIGAVNMVAIRDGKLYGDNTDAIGFWANIEDKVVDKSYALIMGAGGASRAIIVALKMAGFSKITIVNRTIERAQHLAQEFDCQAAPFNDTPNLMAKASLVVNCTSLGMEGQPPLNFDLSLLNPTALVTDIVYNPLHTELLIQAKAQGNPTQTGIGMLLQQARPSFAAWYKKMPEIDDELTQIILGKM